MCFKRLELFSHVLDEAGSPVCTIQSIRSFHMHLLQSRGKDLTSEPPVAIKQATYGIRDRWNKSHRSSVSRHSDDSNSDDSSFSSDSNSSGSDSDSSDA